MAVLATGDKTTQWRFWLDANAVGTDIMSKTRAALVVPTGLAATTDMTTIVQQFVNQK